jgi:hypothetical protein
MANEITFIFRTDEVVSTSIGFNSVHQGYYTQPRATKKLYVKIKTTATAENFRIFVSLHQSIS